MLLTKTSIESERFILRNIDPTCDNLKSYLTWMRNPEENKFIISARHDYSLEELNDFIKLKNDSLDSLLLGIFDKFDNKHIGNIKLEPLILNQSACIGILIGDSIYRNKGVGFEILNKVIRFTNLEYSVRHFYLGVDSHNYAAIRLYTKLNFRKDTNKLNLKDGIEMSLYL